MKIRKRTRVRAVAAVVIAAIAGLGMWGIVAPAAADVPTTPAVEFVAPLCEGTTLDDPTDSSGPVANLASVFGTRLVAYNEGRAVPLYDVFGSNNNNGYPAVCGTRYVAGVGPVSEWMFCTDYFSHVCSGVDEDGNLLGFDGEPIPNMDTLPGANPKLTSDQEKLIAYLVQHGRATYAGTGGFSMNNATRAVADGDSWERAALQILVWCISDPVAPAPTGSEAERAATCEDNMSAATQAEILASIPDDPALTVAGPAAALPVGETAQFTVTTDVFTSPLTVTTGGVAASLTVISGPGVLTGSQLQVSGGDAPVAVVLGVTATGAGVANLDATATPTATSHIGWNQSPGLSADQKPCQVFATFHVADQVVLDGAATATFVTDDGADADAGAGAGGNADAGAEGNAGAGAAGNAGAGAGGTAASAAGGSATSAGAGSGANGSGQGSLAATGSEPVAPVVVMAAFAALLLGAVIARRTRRRLAEVVAE